MPRRHLTAALLAKPVSMLSANELKKWRDSLIGGELEEFIDQQDVEVFADRIEAGRAARSANPEHGRLEDRP